MSIPTGWRIPPPNKLGGTLRRCFVDTIVDTISEYT